MCIDDRVDIRSFVLRTILTISGNSGRQPSPRRTSPYVGLRRDTAIRSLPQVTMPDRRAERNTPPTVSGQGGATFEQKAFRAVGVCRSGGVIGAVRDLGTRGF